VRWLVAFVPAAVIAAIRRTDVTEYVAGIAASLRLDARELDHLGPFLGVFGNELAEIGG